MIDIVSAVERLDDYKDEYVYDIAMANQELPYFFANNILVHNSAHFTLQDYVDNLEDAIKLADDTANKINDYLPLVSKEDFLCSEGYDNLIKVGLELVADNGMYLTRKKYILHKVFEEGEYVDKLKEMGTDSKKSSNPAPLQSFLKTLYAKLLRDGQNQEQINKFVIQTRKKIRDKLEDYGMPKSISKLEYYNDLYSEARKKAVFNRMYNVESLFLQYTNAYEEIEIDTIYAIVSDMHSANSKRLIREMCNYHNMDIQSIENMLKEVCANIDTYKDDMRLQKLGHVKCRLPGHVRSAIYHNLLIKHFNDELSAPIASGDKIKTYYLHTDNQFGISSIAFSMELDNLPQWFTDNFEIDLDKMLLTLVDNKLEVYYDALKWNIPDECAYLIQNINVDTDEDE